MKNRIAETHHRRRAVEAITGLSRSTIYRLMDEGDFPKPVRLSKGAVAWPESVIADWLQSRAEQS